jgi:ADP-heptose:LPS heptosyltransferase
MNSLMQGLKEKYPEYNIYFVTNPVFFPMIEDSPYIHKLLPFKKEMENLLLLEGQGDHKGYFDIAFLPFVGTQKYLNYMHNGLDR